MTGLARICPPCHRATPGSVETAAIGPPIRLVDAAAPYRAAAVARALLAYPDDPRASATAQRRRSQRSVLVHGGVRIDPLRQPATTSGVAA